MTVIASPRGRHQVEHQKAMAKGLASLGIEPVLASGNVSSTEHVACWGWRLGRSLRNRGHEVLVMERGYLGDRFYWTSLGWNGLNGNAEFPEYPDDGGERFRSHYKMKAWRTDGEYVLLMGQVPGDASLRGADLSGWYVDAAMKAQNAYEMPVRFHEHPMAVRRGIRRRPRFTEPSIGTLDEALSRAAVVVTYNSNSAVDAVMAGVPAVTLDKGSMAWDVAAHRIGELHRPAREAWAHGLAWRQWSLDEIASGFALQGAMKELA